MNRSSKFNIVHPTIPTCSNTGEAELRTTCGTAQTRVEKKRKSYKKLGEPKFSYVSIKTTKYPAKAGDTCLILYDFVTLMRNEKLDFKKKVFCPKL